MLMLNVGASGTYKWSLQAINEYKGFYILRSACKGEKKTVI